MFLEEVTILTKDEVLQQLEQLATERTKKIYMSNGAKEPVFGVATGAMKPMKRIIKKNQALADELYATGNYDAMYFAGVIADPLVMTEEHFDRWIADAYFYMISDFVVAVTLAESPLAQLIADKWINSGDELVMSAGWSCYCWLLGNQKDDQFDKEKLAGMLQRVQKEIKDAPERTKVSMNNFVYTVGLSYIPLHDEALAISKAIGPIEIVREGKKNSILNAYEAIEKEKVKNRIGFKRKYVRC